MKLLILSAYSSSSLLIDKYFEPICLSPLPRSSFQPLLVPRLRLQLRRHTDVQGAYFGNYGEFLGIHTPMLFLKHLLDMLPFYLAYMLLMTSHEARWLTLESYGRSSPLIRASNLGKAEAVKPTHRVHSSAF